jgi:hypothetical protein
MRAANPEIDAWAPDPGAEMVIPTFRILPRAPQEGIVVNLAENAIKHGVSRVVGKGIIELRAGRNEDALLITIRDNGPGLVTENGAGSPTYSEGIGLRNIRERLSELYGKDAYLVLESAEGGGMMATISLPYHTQYDLATVAFWRIIWNRVKKYALSSQTTSRSPGRGWPISWLKSRASKLWDGLRTASRRSKRFAI